MLSLSYKLRPDYVIVFHPDQNIGFVSVLGGKALKSVGIIS